MEGWEKWKGRRWRDGGEWEIKGWEEDGGMGEMEGWEKRRGGGEMEGWKVGGWQDGWMDGRGQRETVR